MTCSNWVGDLHMSGILQMFSHFWDNKGLVGNKCEFEKYLWKIIKMLVIPFFIRFCKTSQWCSEQRLLPGSSVYTFNLMFMEVNVTLYTYIFYSFQDQSNIICSLTIMSDSIILSCVTCCCSSSLKLYDMSAKWNCQTL